MQCVFKTIICAVTIGLFAVPVVADETDLAEIIANGGCPGCDLDLAELRSLSLPGADFSRADLRNADMKHASLAGASFVRADLQRAEMERAQLTDSVARRQGDLVPQTPVRGGRFQQRGEFLVSQGAVRSVGALPERLQSR